MADTPPKWLAWAADLLDLASDRFSGDGCNDIDWPTGWTEAEKAEFVAAVAGWNGTPDDIDYDSKVYYDWLAMAFLAARIRGMIHG